MTSLCRIAGLCLLLALSAAGAAEFKLVGGATVSGDPVSFSEQGVVFRLADGKLSERVQWFKFEPETLQGFLKDPKAKKFVEPLVAPPPEEKAAPKKTAYQIKEPPKPEPPQVKGLVSAAGTPIGLAMLAVIFLANLFAAYEIAVFRNYPPAFVCGAAVVLPALGPLVFLCLKSRPFEPIAPAEPTPTLEETVAPPPPPMPKPGIPGDEEESGPGLSLAAKKQAAGELPRDYRKEFKRGDFIFNRRFFETNFPGFFRVVPSDAEKDLVMVVRSVRGEYIGRRISRIGLSELHLQVQSGGASSEAMIPFNDMTEVIIRHAEGPD